MLTDVYVEQLTALGWLTSHFQKHIQVVPTSALVDPGVPIAQLAVQGYLEMQDAKNAAEVAALHTLGWKIPTTKTGAVVTAVVSSTPASKAGLHVADKIVSVNGKATTSSCGLIDVASHLAPGTLVHLRIDRAHISTSGNITYASATSTLSLRTETAKNIQDAGCPGNTTPASSWLGIGVEDGFSYALPGTITINTKDIGGPSAGLAMTLSLINQLSAGSLTNQHVVAATGTMSTTGQVGDVGGVAEKTVAVENAGATVFIVPSVEVATAKGASNGHLRVIGVNTLAQALAALRRLGGTAPIALTKPN
jgi:PDZ domain-containing protein